MTLAKISLIQHCIMNPEFQGNVSNIINVNNRGTRTTLGAFIVKLNILQTKKQNVIILVIIAEFGQTNAHWARETIVLDKTIVFSNCGNILSYGFGKFAELQE